MELTDAERVLQQQIHSTLWFAFWLGLALFLIFFLGQREEDYGPTRVDRWRATWRTARSVKPSVDTRSDYVVSQGQVSAANTGFPASTPTETETRSEAETAETDPARVVMGRETLDKLLAQARAQGYLEGGADVFGGLLGGGFLDQVREEKRLTEAKEFVFADREGKPVSGRVLSGTVNPRIRTAAERAAARRPIEPTELRTVGINANGERQEVVL